MNKAIEIPERDFFYTSHDKYLFWIAGYTADGNTSSVVKMTESLTEDAQYFADLVGCKLEEVQTTYINSSPKYKYMRVFYIKTDNPHPKALLFGSYQHCGTTYFHTMQSVLTT